MKTIDLIHHREVEGRDFRPSDLLLNRLIGHHRCRSGGSEGHRRQRRRPRECGAGRPGS
jgi:hypothetical protein